MEHCSLLSTHGLVLVCIYRDPDIRLRDIATTLGITERRAHDIVADLARAGFVVRTRSGRRNHYEIQGIPTLDDADGRQRNTGDLMAFLATIASFTTGAPSAARVPARRTSTNS